MIISIYNKLIKKESQIIHLYLYRYSWKRGMLIPFLDKLRAVRKQNSRFNTGYKFGKRSQNNFGKNADKQSKNPKVHNNEVEDNFYQ